MKGFGRDADGQSSIEGRWSGEGNVMFWMERTGRIVTFCSGVYECSLEVGTTKMTLTLMFSMVEFRVVRLRADAYIQSIRRRFCGQLLQYSTFTRLIKM
jgi:hypothetical protein